MKTAQIIALLFCSLLAAAKEPVKVNVVSAEVVTHNDQGFVSQTFKAMSPHSPTKQVESYNLKAEINGEHVMLSCVDRRCESLAPGTYDGLNYGGRYIRIKFPLPLRDKLVTRSYKIVGSW